MYVKIDGKHPKQDGQIADPAAIMENAVVVDSHKALQEIDTEEMTKEITESTDVDVLNVSKQRGEGDNQDHLNEDASVMFDNQEQEQMNHPEASQATTDQVSTLTLQTGP